MNDQDFNDFSSIADMFGSSLGQNITNPTPLDRAIADTYPNRRVILDFFVYSAIFANAGNGNGFLAPGAAAPVAIVIAADSDFVLLEQACHADIANAGQTYQTETLPLATVMLQDQTSGRSLFDQAQPISSIFGSGRQPWTLPVPRIIKAKTTFNVTVTSFDPANYYNIRLSFIGVKVFDAGPAS